VIFTLYLTWSPWHYSGQNYGIFLLFARRAGAQPDNRHRRALYSAFLLSYAILFSTSTPTVHGSILHFAEHPSSVSSAVQIATGHGLSGV